LKKVFVMVGPGGCLRIPQGKFRPIVVQGKKVLKKFGGLETEDVPSGLKSRSATYLSNARVFGGK
jgi:hypothetical protein